MTELKRKGKDGITAVGIREKILIILFFTITHSLAHTNASLSISHLGFH